MGSLNLEIIFDPLANGLGIKHNLNDTISLFGLAMARLMPIIYLTPFLGGKLVIGPVKIILASLFSIWVLPYLSSSFPTPLEIPQTLYALLFIKELLLGIVLGFSGSLIFWGAEIGGRFIDNVRGTTTANLLLPQFPTQSTLLGDLYFQLFIVLFIAINGHLVFLDVVWKSYLFLSPSQFTFDVSQFPTLISATSYLLALGAKLAAPALFALILLDVILGVANKLAPQLEVFFLSMTLKSSLGILFVGLSIYYLHQLFATEVENFANILRNLILK